MLECNLIDKLYTYAKNKQFGRQCSTDTILSMYKIHKLESTNCLDYDHLCFTDESCTVTTTYTCDDIVTGFTSNVVSCNSNTVTITIT